MKINKAIGLDNISARLLKDSSHVIADSLTALFNRSLSTNTVPSIWKSGRVTSLFKSGNRCDPNNYRPITILPTISKLLEKIVHVQLYSYLNEHKLITPSQFGFRPKLSTGVALAHFTDNILSNMDSGRFTGAAFLDLSKAFDTVNHESLISKLECLGLDQDSIDWFKSYLSERSQTTSVGDIVSAFAPMSIGVPQGSILGPLLFIIYVNDLPSCKIVSNMTIYADDTVLYYSSNDANKLEETLNADLVTVSGWFRDNLLTLNGSKCKFVLFGSAQKLKTIRDLSIYADNHTIECAKSFKYLGVTVQQNMSWTEHVDKVCTKINQRLGILRRIKHLLPIHARVTLYNSLICPLFDYADFVWGDKNNSSLMSHLQTLQNKAAKLILDVPVYSSATHALSQLSWNTLQLRRVYHRVVLAYKYLNGHIDYHQLNVQYNKDVHSHNTRRSNNIRLPLAHRNWGKQTLLYTLAEDWNSLPSKLREIRSLQGFKAQTKIAVFHN